jgi:hypothetical protein
MTLLSKSPHHISSWYAGVFMPFYESLNGSGHICWLSFHLNLASSLPFDLLKMCKSISEDDFTKYKSYMQGELTANWFLVQAEKTKKRIYTSEPAVA